MAWEILSVSDRAWIAGLASSFGANLVLMVLSETLRWRWSRWFALVLLGSTYVVAHTFVLGIQLLPALAVVGLLIAYVQVRILAERFAPLFMGTITSAQRHQFGRALRRALTRLAAALLVAVVVPLFAADLAVAGVIPVTTISTALLLAAGLVVVVVIIALLPTLDARAREGSDASSTRRDSSKLPP